MSVLQEIFNNREIAIGIWGIVALVASLLSKPVRQSLWKVLSILFDKKFLVFYVAFISFLILVLQFLRWTTLWDSSLLKDTIFWVLFVELPLCAKAVNEAKDAHFFTELIKENLKVIALFEFFVSFWTFNLVVELILVPITVIFAALCALASREKQHKPVKKFFDGLLSVWSVILIINAIYCTVRIPAQFFNWETLKSLTLPLTLLILNLPVVYGLALYSGYEQLFIKIKSGAKEKGKMKLQLILFAGFSLPKVSAVRRNLSTTIHVSLTANDLCNHLRMLERHLSMQIGENYMKRANYYIGTCITAAIASFVGLALANTDVPIKDIIAFNFVLDIPRIKEILTYIFSVSLVFSIALLFYSIGFRKKKNEEISQIKKYALFEFLFALKRQKEQLQEYPPIDDPISLFVNYMLIADELKEACTKALDVYGNLLNAWERESIDLLRSSTIALLTDATIGGGNFSDYDVKRFCDYYNTKVKDSQYSKDFNSFTTMVKGDVEKYGKRIEQTYDDFKRYY